MCTASLKAKATPTWRCLQIPQVQKAAIWYQCVLTCFNMCNEASHAKAAVWQQWTCDSQTNRRVLDNKHSAFSVDMGEEAYSKLYEQVKAACAHGIVLHV